MKFTFRSGSVSRQLFQGFAWHDFLPFISHFGSSPISLSGESGCGVASRRRKSRWLWWGLGRAGWFPGLEFCRSFPAPTRISAEKKTFHSWHRPELPCETHFLPWRTAGSSSVQGNPENQLPARRGGGGEGASAPSLGLRATRAPRYPTAAEGGRRGRRRRRGAGRAAVALGRHLLLAAAPGAGRRGYCLDRACRALRLRRRRRRPEPEPRGRAGSMAAPSPGRPSGCPSFRPSLPAFPPRPRALFSSSSRFPAAAPSRPSSFFFPGGGGSPGKRKGWGQAAASSPQELAGPRQGPRLRPAPPRHIHSSERLRGAGRGGRERRERRRKGAGALGSHCLTGRGGNSATAPAARGEEQRAAAAAPRRGRGGLPRASPQPPTAGLEAGASQSPRAGAVRADVCGGRRWGAVGGGGGRRAGGRGAGLVAAGGSLVRPAAAQASEACCRYPAAQGGGLRRSGARLARCPAWETESLQASSTPADWVSLYDSDRFKSSPDFKAAGISFNCSTPTSSNGTLGLQETTAAARRSFPRRPLLRACSLSNAAPPSLSLTPVGRQSWPWDGGKWPAKLPQDNAFVRGNIGYTPIRDVGFQPWRFRSCSRWISLALVIQPGSVCVYCGESCLGILSTHMA